MHHQERASAIFRRYLLASLAVATVVGILFMLHALRNVLLMLSFSAFLAYFLAWPIQWLSRKMPRPAATRVVFYTFFLLLLGSIPTVGALLYVQSAEFVKALPGYLQELPSQYDLLNNLLIGLQQQYVPGKEAQGLDAYLSQLIAQMQTSAPDIINKAMAAAQTFLSGAGTVMAGVLIVPIIALYLLLDASRFRRTFVRLFPEKTHSNVERALDAINKSLGGYIYSRVVMALIIFVVMAMFMAFIGVPYWLLLAVGLFIGEFIPVVGGLLAFIPIGIVILVGPQPTDIVWVLGANLTMQVIQNYVIAPKLTGDTMNIHPLTVVIAMLVGGSVGGVAGLLLALPAAAAGKILLNIFVLKLEEKGIEVPALDLLPQSGEIEFMERGEDTEYLIKPEQDNVPVSLPPVPGDPNDAPSA
ncbi:AI-2E family transporter [bacterium]|nr:AI-2E family transporter [bacterium]